VVYIALIARITRATMLEVLAQDYIRTAKAKGVASARSCSACAEERRGADRHRHRHRHRAADRRRGGDRERVRDPGLGRLTVDAILRRDYPIIQGVILLFSLRLRAGQPADRPQLHPVRSRGSGTDERGPAADGPPRFPPKPPTDRRPPVQRRRAFAGFAARNPTIAVGGVVLLLMVAWRSSRRWLGTTDPTGAVADQADASRWREFWFGTDMLGRDVYSRVIYGARVSLIVGFAVAVWRLDRADVIGLVSASCAGSTRS
jgi:hypothetical protein